MSTAPGAVDPSDPTTSRPDRVAAYRKRQIEPYPTRPEVEYVFLAEFDIDQGSVLRHEYPAKTGTDQHLLAEHMLPDGAHDRPEDWTVFYLNQIPSLTVDPTLLSSTPEGLEAQAKRTSRGGEPTSGLEGVAGSRSGGTTEGRGLLYVMSLVRTKKDATVRRGALVKALAVATRNPYIQIYKPILLLALEDYFSTPSISVLAKLYSAINSIETPALPSLTLDERIVLRTSDRKDLFEEKFDAAATQNGSRQSQVTGGLSRTPSAASRLDTVSSSTKESQDDAEQIRDAGSPIWSDDDSSLAEVLSPVSIGAGGSSFLDSRIRSTGSMSSLTSVATNSKDVHHAYPGSGSSRPPSATPTTASTDDLSDPLHSRSRANTVTSSEGGTTDASSRLQRDFLYSTAASHPLPTSASGSAGLGFDRTSLPPSLSGAAGKGTGAAGYKPKDTHWYETKVAYGGINLPIRIPLGTFPREIGEYSLIHLIQTFSGPSSLVPSSTMHPALHTSGHATPPIIVLFNALVTNHRVVFLGHGQPAGKVAELVLAACALASGSGAVLEGFEERAFPYTNLSNLDNLEKVPGYIAGVCNPAFADRPSWWDVLCNIETGKIIVSKDLRSAGPTPTFSSKGGIGLQAGEKGDDGGRGDKSDHRESADSAFMDEILHAIQAHYGEPVIRARFADYANRFIRLASRWEEETTSSTTIGYPCQSYRDGRLGSGIVFGDEAHGTREIVRDSARIEGWMATRSYKLYREHFKRSLEFAPLRDFDLVHQLSRLRQGRQLCPGEVQLIVQTLAQSVQSDEQVVAFLAHLPSHFGGLLPVSFGLFHPAPQVRSLTLDLLDQVGSHPTGRKYLSTLNAFHRTAYHRLSSERRQIQFERQLELERDRERAAFRQASEAGSDYKTNDGDGDDRFAQGAGGGGGGGGGGARDREATVTIESLQLSDPGRQALPPPVPVKDG
ncbi:hypothetical protein JCM10212_004929 [Sporobolomyces blumeae]